MLSMQHRGELQGTTESEFEHLIGKLRSFLLNEHNDDGTHGNITADSINVNTDQTTGATGDLHVGGSGLIDGDLEIKGTVTAATKQIYETRSQFVKLLIDSFGYAGLQMRSVLGALVANWRIHVDFTPSPASNGLVFADMTQLSGYTPVIRLEPNSGTPGLNYRLIPSGPTLLDLGASAVGDRLIGVYAYDVNALNGFTERFRTTPLGEWITPAFNAGNFTASAGAWTVDAADVGTYAYTLIGKTMILMFEIASTSVTAAPATLRIAVPGGFTAAKQTRNLINTIDAGGPFNDGIAVINAGATVINCYSSSAAAGWTTTAANNTAVLGQIVFEVQ